MPYRKPLDVSTYIEALGDDEAELKHVMKLSERGRYNDGEPYKWPNDGIAISSSSTTLARRDYHVWDPNGYYSTLGFTENLTEITKKQLRLAYRSLLEEPDVDQVWITYCFKQLLNEQVRRDYNAIPIGEFYFDDYWEEFYKQKANEQVAQHRAAGEDIDINDILARWGLYAEDQDESMNMDWHSAEDMVEKPKKVIESEWDWAFYVWDARTVNLYYMEMWQKYMLAAFDMNRRYGRDVLAMSQFAVGVMGHATTADTPRVHYRMHIEGEMTYFVFYLRSDVKPTRKDAEESVRILLRNLSNGIGTEKFLKVRGKPARV